MLAASALASVASLLAACASGNLPQGGTPRESVETRPVSPNPGDPDRRAQARLELASLYFSRGQHQTALDEIAQALAARPDLPEAVALEALVRAATGDIAGAEASFAKAKRLAPGDGNVIHNHAWFLCQQRRFGEAQAAFEQALTMPRYDGQSRTLLAQGVCLAREQRWPEAERTLSRSYEFDPANPVTAYNLAEVLLRRGELTRARFYVGRVNAVPEQVNAQSLWLAARIERRLGNLDAMRELGRQMRERFPQAPETLLFERGRFDD
jgi:type IV pilus assembly protein PilF